MATAFLQKRELLDEDQIHSEDCWTSVTLGASNVEAGFVALLCVLSLSNVMHDPKVLSALRT